MKALGCDPSSSCCGFATVEDEALHETFTWTPYKDRSAAWNLWNYYSETNRVALRLKVEQDYRIAVVEFLSVSRNARTARVLSHYQAATVIACKAAGMTVLEARAKTVRKLVLGNGNLDKEAVFEEIKRRYPDHKFKPKTRGGMDESDATVLGLAAEALIESK